METDESKLQNDSAANTAFVTAFIEITSSSNEEALFFLESHNWDLDAAVSTFLDNHTAPIDADSVEAINTAPRPRQHSPDFAPSQSPSRSRSSSPPISRAPYELRSTRTRGGTEKKVDNRASGSRTRGSGIRTLSDLNRPAVEGSDSDSDEFQEYYTGGEKSGMLVQDPTKGKSVDAIFDQARQSAVDGPIVPPSRSKSFTGTARLLSGETVPSIPQHPESITHTITFWRNGFSIDDGPLRRLDDPVNAPFLESIRRSECPRELEPADRRTSVHVNLVRKDEDYPEPVKHRHTSFQGVGRTLASGTPNPSESTTAATSPNIAPSPSIGLVVDETLPITSIQLRLADGTRMVSRFNLHHTIRDIRGFIDASRPSGARNYQLQTMGFPPKQLAVLDQSIEQAGIANSVVIQKF